MKKPWVILFVALVVGIIIVGFSFTKEEELLNKPKYNPPLKEVLPPGASTQDIIKTADETEVPRLIRPTPIVRQTTNNLIELACEGGTDNCKLEAIYHFVRLNFEYTARTLETPYLRSPGEMLLYGRGWELEFAMLIASMQRAAGFENEIVRSTSNVWVRTFIGNESIMIDPSCTSCSVMESSVTLRGDEVVYR